VNVRLLVGGLDWTTVFLAAVVGVVVVVVN